MVIAFSVVSEPINEETECHIKARQSCFVGFGISSWTYNGLILGVKLLLLMNRKKIEANVTDTSLYNT